MTKAVYPNPIPKHLQHLSEWRLRCLFYLCDEDGNEVLNKDGTIKEFYFKGRLKPLEYLCEDMTVKDLEEVKDENNK